MKGGRPPTKRTPERKIEHRRFTLSRPFHRFSLYLFRSRSKSRIGKRRSIIKTCDNNSGVVGPWSDINHDELLLVMMKLGVVDFLAFSGVCKSWRSPAVSNRNIFMVSRPPMPISVSTNRRKKQQCYLEDFEGRKFKIRLPHFNAGMRCIGVTGGYLILYNQYTNDCVLVNLITMHELHFPDVPNGASTNSVFCCPGFFRSILIFSPSIFGWVFVVVNICHEEVWFCIAGKRKWTKVSTRFGILNLHASKGKIYTLACLRPYDSDCDRVCELRLYPKTKVVLLKTENYPKLGFRGPRFVSSGENLYVIDQLSKHPFKVHELDFGEMKWVSRENTGGEKYAFFRNGFNDCGSFTLREAWADIHSQYGRYVVKDEEGNGLFHASWWYFLDDCLNVNLINE